MPGRKTIDTKHSGKSEGYSDEMFREFERDLIKLVRESKDRITGNIRDEAEHLIDKYVVG